MKKKKLECDICGEEKLCGCYDCFNNFHGFADANPVPLGYMVLCDVCLEEQKDVGECMPVSEW